MLRPKAKFREFTSRPPSTARIGAPPAATTPTKVSSAAPPIARAASITVCQRGKPDAWDSAP
nr:hypothetical protein [Rothia kristinae]